MIPTQPTDQKVAAGSDVQMITTVIGTAPFQYQWFMNGLPLLTETNSVLLIRGAQPTHSGTYQVEVRNRAGAVTSEPASLQVIGPDDIPPLSVTRDGEKVVLHWPAVGAEVLLESAEGIGDTLAWTGVNLSPRQVGSEKSLTVQATKQQVYYCLRRL